MATDAVFKFMSGQNRPHSMAEIQQNVGKEFGKAAIQKALDGLVKGHKLFEKTYGKQRIYCLVQVQDSGGGDVDAELRKLNQEIAGISTNLQDVEVKLRENECKLSTIKGKMSVAEGRVKKRELEEEIVGLKRRLQEFATDFKPVSQKERDEVDGNYDTYLKEYKKRKRDCKEIICQIMENYPKTEKQLLEEVGIETDEDVNFKLNL